MFKRVPKTWELTLLSHRINTYIAYFWAYSFMRQNKTLFLKTVLGLLLFVTGCTPTRYSYKTR